MKFHENVHVKDTFHHVKRIQVTGKNFMHVYV